MLADDIADYVNLAVAGSAALPVATGTVVTSPQHDADDPLTVVFDGSAVAQPVKQLRGFPVFPGMRVGLIKFGGDWTLVGAYTTAADAAVPVENTGGGNPTITGAGTTVYVPTGTPFGVAFVAPPSGAVKVTMEGWLACNSATIGRRSYMSADAREGSTINAGTVVLAAADSRAGITDNHTAAAGNKYTHVTRSWFVTGLTPGDDYNVTSMLRQDNTADTAALNQRHVMVEPLPFAP